MGLLNLSAASGSSFPATSARRRLGRKFLKGRDPLRKVCKTPGQSDWCGACSQRTIRRMDQITLGLDPLPKKTRKEVFLEEMNQVMPWVALAALIQPHARGAHQA